MPIAFAQMRLWYSAASNETAQRVLDAWPGAPVENQELLGMLLEIAREQVMEFAPDEEPADEIVWLLTRLGFADEQIDAALVALGTTTPLAYNPPSRYIYAQLQQAKNLWAAGTASSDGDIGPDGSPQYSFQPRPLDKTIRQIIRPTSGAVDVF